MVPSTPQTTVGATLTYAISISFSKLSILAFYLRVSPDQNFRRAVYLLIGVVCAYTVSYILVIVFRCQPLAAGWDLAVKGRCIDYLVPMMVLSIANILIDLVILCLPIKVIVPLQIPTRQKLSLVFLFATGGFVCAAAIKRTIIMPPLLASTDYAWDLPEQFVWSFVEVNAGVVCASLAALKPLFMRYIPFLIVSRLRSSQERSTAPDSSAPGTDKNASSSTHTTVYGEALELPSREDLPAPTVVGHRDRDASDDEAQLWSHGRKPASSLNSDSNRNDADSVDGLGGAGGGGGHGGAGGGDLYPGARPPRFTVSGSGYGMAGPRSPDAIQVTKETLVSYGK
ncbi:hypothetical protein CDD83_10603 [Cordyceps sp. RAO-2017]|nr:hypothetical protein CDD83_10603 [Cordyceps sp. RAO-2017]